MKINKYCIENYSGNFEIELPFEAQILSAQNQHETLCLWVAFDEKETRREKRKIKILFTGFDYKMNPDDVFVSTIQFKGGNLVVHVFEKIEK